MLGVHLAVSFVQALLILLLSPLLTGVIKKVKARLQSRRGPSVLQPYYDILKYLRKDAVISEQASWLTTAVPYLSFAAVLAAGMLLPMWSVWTGFTGDVILFVYLLGISRFFTALAALDAGSSFGGMGASREMALNTMVEPALFLAVFAVILQAGTTDLTLAVQHLQAGGWHFLTLSYGLSFAAMLLVVIAETGRIPVDNPDTHLELTMIHEGMLLEYSGRYLGLVMWGAMMKQFVILSLFAGLFFPVGLAETFSLQSVLLGILLLVGKVFLLGIVLAVIEMTYAKLRFFQLPKLFVTSMMLSILAVTVNFFF